MSRNGNGKKGFRKRRLPDVLRRARGCRRKLTYWRSRQGKVRKRKHGLEWRRLRQINKRD
jgi:hypothetical protein